MLFPESCPSSPKPISWNITKRERNRTAVVDLNRQDIFQVSGNTYIYIGNFKIEGGITFNALCMNDGCFEFFDDDSWVEVFENAKLVLEE